jgi:Zn-dependent protease
VNIDLSLVLLQYFCLLLSLCVHEASHALMADRCGDPTARFMGRLTLNPLPHIDPIGTVVMPLLMIVFPSPLFIGWAKPVPVNTRNLRNQRSGPVWVAVAGPMSNLLLALVGAVALRIAYEATGSPYSPLCLIALTLVSINVSLLLFNLIPVPPLDGHYLLYYFLPPAGQEVLERIGPFGIIIAMILARPLLSGPFEALHGLILRAAMLGS